MNELIWIEVIKDNLIQNIQTIREVIGEKTIADAILDRIVHDAHRIELKGASLRKSMDKYKEIETVN